jgi:adenylosuccinate synthase
MVKFSRSFRNRDCRRNIIKEYKMNKVDIVVGLQYGDEGKGKICKSLVEAAKTESCYYRNVARFNGGPNAGHTVYRNDEKIVLHQLNSGLFDDHCNILIGPGCVVDIEKLVEEIKQFPGIEKRVYISNTAHVITKEHIEEDKKDSLIGTTGQGIGPCYSDKMKRVGDTWDNLKYDSSLFKDDLLGTKILRILSDNLLMSGEGLFETNIFNGYTLMEGAQGIRLDIDHGYYPFVTSCNCMPQHALTTFGIPINEVRSIYGVAKYYQTYSGSNDSLLFCTEKDEEKFREYGNEFGATTGRPRHIGYLNLDQLISAIKMTGVNILVFNKVDIIEEVGVFKLVIDFEEKEFDNFESMKYFVKDVLRSNFIDLDIINSGDANGKDFEKEAAQRYF